MGYTADKAMPTNDPKQASLRGNLFVISGPSGVGKGTLVKKVSEADSDVWVSISATTRSPRQGETNGKEYFFLTPEEFESEIEEDGFIEYATYNGNYYGTPVKPIEEHLEAGNDVVLEIEVKGAKQIKEKFPEATMIFIEPPSLDVLRSRLNGRGTEDESTINSRLETARLELGQKLEYDIQIVNDDIDIALDELLRAIDGKR